MWHYYIRLKFTYYISLFIILNFLLLYSIWIYELSIPLSALCILPINNTDQFMVDVGGKKLLTPQPRLRTGFFSVLESQMLPPGTINEACTSAGVGKYGKPIGLDEKLKVDLIVIGSVAVNPKTGARLGKGEVLKSPLFSSMVYSLNGSFFSVLSSYWCTLGVLFFLDGSRSVLLLICRV